MFGIYAVLIFPYLGKNIFISNRIFIRRCFNTIRTDLSDTTTIYISYSKANRMATAFNTKIDFCGNICTTSLNKITNNNIFQTILILNIFWFVTVGLLLHLSYKLSLCWCHLTPKFESFRFSGNMFSVATFWSLCFPKNSMVVFKSR